MKFNYALLKQCYSWILNQVAISGLSSNLSLSTNGSLSPTPAASVSAAIINL